MNTDTVSEEKLFHRGLFAGKRVLITGAGRGIGAAIAQYLADDGARVFAHLGKQMGNDDWVYPRSGANINEVDLSKPPKVEAEQTNYVCAADLSAAENARLVAQHAGELMGGIDMLVNNAGTMLGRVLAAEMTLEHYHRVTDLNARSVVLLTTATLPYLKDAQSASIVNVSSISADTGGSAGSSIYSAAKGFVST